MPGRGAGPPSVAPEQCQERGLQGERGYDGDEGDDEPGETEGTYEGHRDDEKHREADRHRDTGEQHGAPGGCHRVHDGVDDLR